MARLRQEVRAAARRSRVFRRPRLHLSAGPVIAVFIVLFVLALLSLAASTACALRPAVGTGSGAAQPGALAPEFQLNTLDGTQLRLADLRGKAVVLNFWASWCGPCRSEMPYFERTYRTYQDRGVAFVGAAIEDDLAAAGAFVKELGITYPVGLDEGNRIATSYQLVGLPSTVFISREGQIVRRASGLIDEGQLVKLVEEIAQ